MSIVVLVVFAVVAALVVGFAKRGRLQRLMTPLPARNRLVLTALGFYVLGVFASWTAWESALATFSALSWSVIAFYAWVNRWMPGARLIAAGLALNALVLLLNGSVPVSPEAAARAGVNVSAITTDNATLADDSTRLSWLAKSIPVAFPPRPEVVSPGDIAIAAGLAAALVTGMTGRWPSTNALPARRRRYRYADDYVQEYLRDDEPDPDSGGAEPAGTSDEKADPREHATMNRRADGDTSPIRRQASGL